MAPSQIGAASQIGARRFALAAVGGRCRQAAERLGIGLRTLYDKLKKYGLG